MTDQQKRDYYRMRDVLITISGYQTSEQLRECARDEYGLDYEEALEMAYENVISTAGSVLKGVNLVLDD